MSNIYRIRITNGRSPRTMAGGLPVYSDRDTFVSVREAARAIIDGASEIIHRDVTDARDMPDDDAAYEAELNRRINGVCDEIVRTRSWWHDGVTYSITEEDERAPLYIARIRSYYGPREEMDVMHDCYDTVNDATESIRELEDDDYRLASGESGRPEYLIVGQDTVDWLDDSDQSKYDWYGCRCRHAEDADMPRMPSAAESAMRAWHGCGTRTSPMCASTR